jgi:cytochrome c553/cytochrome c5
MKRRWVIRGLLGALLLGLVGFIGVVLGVVPVKASSGHWPPTVWFLQFAKRRSVAMHARFVDVPPLSAPWLVAKGAGHYETGCRPCHGSPDLPQPRVARAMTPSPPYLPPRIAQWKPEEIFYIVKHGIKFTGMPAWPSLHRDDEVWAMVAFLREMPRLDAGGYNRLVHGTANGVGSSEPLPELAGDVAPPRAVVTSCARCHGRDGLGRDQGASPRLAGQQQRYLGAALVAYGRDQRASGTMQAVAAALSAQEIAELAAYYAGLPAGTRGSGPAASNSGDAGRGQEIVSRGIPVQGVPACRHCHGPGARPRNPAYPGLASQFESYLALQLELFKSGRRGGSSYASIMSRIAGRLRPEQMRDVAAYYASLDENKQDPVR